MVRLVLLRKKHKLTQRRLANILGCSYSYVSMLESGQRMPNTEIAEKMAGFFGVTVDYLMGIDKENKQSNNMNELMDLYQSLDQNEKQELLDFANFLSHKKRIH